MQPQMIPRPANCQFTASRPKVYSYARFSTPEQAQGDSFRRQTEAARAWAKARGLELDDKFRIADRGVSAYRGDNAVDGDLGKFLEACRRGLIEPGSFLVVESLDRISRMPPRRAQRLISDIVESDVTLVTLNDNQTYTADRLDNDPTALLIALMVSLRAHEESKTKGRRVASAWAEKRRRVRENPEELFTRRAPSWLRWTSAGWEEDKNKADVVRRIFGMTLAGLGEHKIASVLNDEQVPPLGCGRHWHRSTVAKVLRNPAVTGTLQVGHIEHRDGRKRRVVEDAISNAFPPVISERDWLAVRALKGGQTPSARGRHAGNGVAHLLAGLARCPGCGGRMTRVSKGSARKAGQPKLVCVAAKSGAGCRYVSVPVNVVEEAFRRGWGNLLANVPAETRGLNEQHAGLTASIEGREDHLEDLTRSAEAAPSISLARAIARVEAELNTLRHELVETDERRRMSDGGLVDARLSDLASLLDPDDCDGEAGSAADVPAINASLKVLFEAVTVDYQTGCLRFHWRQGGEASVVYAWPVALA